MRKGDASTQARLGAAGIEKHLDKAVAASAKTGEKCDVLGNDVYGTVERYRS